MVTSSTMIVRCLLVSLLAVIPLSYGVEFGEQIVTNHAVSEKWVEASNEFDQLVFPQKVLVIDFIKEIIQKKVKLSPDCIASLKYLSTGLKEKRWWAYQFIDSSFKGASGLAYGFISDLGNFDECLRINVNDAKPIFKGQYCMVKVTFPLPEKPENNFLRPYKLNLRETELKDTVYEYYGNHTEMFFYDSFTFAVCTPSTCSRKDLDIILDYKFHNNTLKIESRGCDHRYSYIEAFMDKPWDNKAAVVIVFLLINLVIWSAFVNFYFPGLPVFSAFDPIRNTNKLTTIIKDPEMDKLQFLDSFKFFFQLGGTLAHIICFLPAVPLIFAPIQDRSMDQRDLWIMSQYFQKAIYVTQVILMISGFFTAFYILPMLEKTGGKMNFVLYVLKRFIRTAPATIGAILMMFCASSLFFGPISKEISDQYIQTCRDTWFYTVFNINNFHVTNDICLPQTWTQSADFQLWVLAYIPLKVLHSNPRAGVMLCLLIIAIGVVVPGMVMYMSDLPSPIGDSRPLEIMFLIVYGKTFPRMAYATYNNFSNYFLGVLLGYMCVKKVRIPFLISISLNGLAFGFMTLCFLGPYVWTHHLGLQFSDVGNAIYAGIFKLSFGMAFACSIYNSYTHQEFMYGSWIGNSKIFTVFGRMALSVYVSQLMPIGYYMGMTYEHMPVNWYTLFMRVVSIIVEIYVFGYMVFLLFEAPFLNMGKTLLMKFEKSNKKKTN